MHREARRFLVVAAAVALASAACGGKEPEPAPAGSAPAASAAPAKKYRFAVMPKALNLPVFFYAKTGAERAAKELGNVEVIWRAPDDADPLKQKEILNRSLRASTASPSPAPARTCSTSRSTCHDAGIPVVTWTRTRRARSGSPSGWTTLLRKIWGGGQAHRRQGHGGAHDEPRRGEPGPPAEGAKESLKKHLT